MSPTIQKMDKKKNHVTGLGLQDIREDIVKLRSNTNIQECLAVCKSIVREHSIALKVEENMKLQKNEEDKEVSNLRKKIANFLMRL
jgi:hypothetical protein